MLSSSSLSFGTATGRNKTDKTSGRKRKSSLSTSAEESSSTSAQRSPGPLVGVPPANYLERYGSSNTTAPWHLQQQAQYHHPQQHQYLQQPQQSQQQGVNKMDAEDGAGGGNGGGTKAGGEEAEQPATKRAKLEVAESERLLNFATAADEYELSLKRQKMPRDPLSHRIIEKRRRDRMNNCLADLSRLIPSSYHKQGQGRIEKTEIIEMATRHIMMLQQKLEEAEKKPPKEEKTALPHLPPGEYHCCATKFYMGFKEAQDEVMRFLVEVESINAHDPFCKKIMAHLENANMKFRAKCECGLPSSVYMATGIQGSDHSQKQPPHSDMILDDSPGDGCGSNTSFNNGNGSSAGMHHPLHPQPHHHPHHHQHIQQQHQSQQYQHHIKHGHMESSDPNGSKLPHGNNNITDGPGMAYQQHHHQQQHHQQLLQQQQQHQHFPHPGHHQQMPYYPPAPGGQVVVGAMGSQDESSVEAQQRDQRLRSLLADQQQHQTHKGSSSASSMLSSSSSPTCSSSSVVNTCGGTICSMNSGIQETNTSGPGVVPMFSYSSHLTGLMPSTPESNTLSSSGYVSDLSTMEKTSPTGSTSSRENVYKFKHTITKRFCQEGHHHHHPRHQASDTSSNGSGRDPMEPKWKSNKHHKRSSGSGGSSGMYGDDDSSEGNNSGSNSGSNSNCDNSSKLDSASSLEDCKPCSRRRGNSAPGKGSGGLSLKSENCSSGLSSSTNSGVALPGFILHPQGTHYMPISVHNANLAGLFESGSGRDHGPPVFHPISIPVHFRRPVISMPNVSICTHASSSPTPSSNHRRDRSNKE